MSIHPRIRLAIALAAALVPAACAHDKSYDHSEFPRGTALPPPDDAPALDPGEAPRPQATPTS